MADITKIKLPNNTTYDVKDASALAGVSVSGTSMTFTKRGGATTTVSILTEAEVLAILNS